MLSAMFTKIICMSLVPSTGNTHRVKGPQELFWVSDGIQVSSFVDNCGLSHDCPKDHFSVHLFTGRDNHEYPKLCVDGK